MSGGAATRTRFIHPKIGYMAIFPFFFSQFCSTLFHAVGESSGRKSGDAMQSGCKRRVSEIHFVYESTKNALECSTQTESTHSLLFSHVVESYKQLQELCASRARDCVWTCWSWMKSYRSLLTICGFAFSAVLLRVRRSENGTHWTNDLIRCDMERKTQSISENHLTLFGANAEWMILRKYFFIFVSILNSTAALWISISISSVCSSNFAVYLSPSSTCRHCAPNAKRHAE